MKIRQGYVNGRCTNCPSQFRSFGAWRRHLMRRTERVDCADRSIMAAAGLRFDGTEWFLD